MNLERRTEYLWAQILCHIVLHFDPEVSACVDRSLVVFGPLAEMTSLRKPVVVVPNDIPYTTAATDAYRVPFNGTHLTLWNRQALPDGPGWQAIPSESTPLWYVHNSGTHLPAWNLFGNLFGLLTFQEERELPSRDRHGRFTGAISPRADRGLLEIPAFNEAVAALVAACVGLRQSGRAQLALGSLVRPPVVVLSHDCDILRGNDRWTQSIRAARIFLPILKLRPPRLVNVWWLIRNGVRPRDFYFDNVPGMINLERQFGFTSTFYILNGTPGRFGARSGSRILPELISMIPDQWPIGTHYNYDTFLDSTRLDRQVQEITSIVNQQPHFGRAHYLRFDADKSPSFLAEHGIECDESAGFSDRVAYRCGIGGCFRPYDLVKESPIDLWELPMVIMEDTLKLQFGDKAVERFEGMLTHLGRVGGALSLNVHPGVFYNPEIPRMLGFYHRLLQVCRDCGARGISAHELIAGIPADPQ